MDQSQSNHQYSQNTGQMNQMGGRIDLNNYAPDAKKSNILRSRLYDSGISNIPMPSVKRPIEEKISSKPFSARMNSSKIQSLSPLKKKVQELNTAIIENLNQSYQYAAAQEAKYLGEGKAAYYRQQQVIIPAQPDLQPSAAGRKLQGRMGVSVGQPRMTGQLLNTRRSAQLEPLQNEYGEAIAQNLSKTHVMDPSRIMSGPPSLVYAGFEGAASQSQMNLEQARSKFLLDKLTGKLPQRATALEPLQRTVSQMKEEAAKANEFKHLTSDKVDKGHKDDTSKKKKVQNWTDLDKYIELLLDSKSEEETVFLYLNPNDKGDPYDLNVVPYAQKNEKQCYTLSVKGLTLYEDSVPVEFLSLGQWLIERDSYKHIRELSFFKQFKKWKFMRMWKKNILVKKRSNAKGLLEEKMFSLQSNFHTALFKHRKMMIEMQKEKFIDTCKQTESLTVEKFKVAQIAKQSKCKDQIEKVSENARNNVKDCISKVLKELRDRITGEIFLDEQRKQNNPTQSNNTANMKRKETHDVFTKLGFPPGMTYGHRSSLRKECIKFLRFAYLVDFLSLEALSKIYTESVKEMVTRLNDLDNNASDRLESILTMEFDDSGTQANTAPRSLQPLFYVSVTLSDNKPIAEEMIKQLQIDDFILPPRGSSKVEDFDLKAHVEFEEIIEKAAEASESEATEVDEEPEPKYRDLVPTIHDEWIELKPSQEDFKNLINSTFNQGLQCIKSFVRWNKHRDLLDYADILEDWDWEDTVGDDWEAPDSEFLDPDPWIHDDPIYKNKQTNVDTVVKEAYNKSKQFLQRFQPLLEIYWRNKQFDIDVLVRDDLKNPVETLTNTLRLLKYYTVFFAANLPAQTDIGLLQLDSKLIKEKLLPTPKEIQEKIEKKIPVVSKQRMDDAKKWLENSIQKIQKPVKNVEEFVEQLGDLKDINEKFQSIRDIVSLVEQEMNVLLMEKEGGSKAANKEDAQAMKMATQYINTLTNDVQKVESSEDVQKDRFKKELDKLIPDLQRDVIDLTAQSIEPQYLDPTSEAVDMIKQLDEKWERYVELEQCSEKYNRWQEKLETPQTQFQSVQDCYDQLFYRRLMWRSLTEWKGLTSKYQQSLFKDIDDKEISKQCDKYSKISGQLERQLESNPIQEDLKNLVDTFKGAMPIVSALRNKNLLEDHWKEIREKIQNNELDVEQEGFTLQDLIELDVVQHQEAIVSISTRATGEAKLSSEYEEIQTAYDEIEFSIVPYNQGNDGAASKYNKLVELDKIYEILDTQTANINMVLANRFAAKLRTQGENMKKDLSTLSLAVDEWVAMQKTWMYMEKIFSTAEIKQILPEESNKFNGVNKFWEALMVDALKSKPAKAFMKKRKGNKLVDELRNYNKILDEINNKLQEFLEKKRGEFARAYFLSDDEFLDIIASSDADKMEKTQGVLNKIFDGISRLGIDDNQAISMMSKEKEKVDFIKGIKTSDQIEIFLSKVQLEMKSALTKKLTEGNKKYDEEPRKAWVMRDSPGQVIATVAQIRWTEDTEIAIQNMLNDVQSLTECVDKNKKQILELAELVRDPALPMLRRFILVALITVDVHARDIVEELRKEQVQTLDDFTWKRQLRYYINEDSCRIEQVQATMQYGYEYMGATSRLVITPLTDRCWITISMALHIQRGANPAGPAGTGKTESTKDLAKAIALLCIVFNCSDQVDYVLVGKLFSGLCQQGCWACLDEFNRIDIEVLSVIAQQLLTIRNALLKLKGNPEDDLFMFEGKSIPCKAEFGCHITMNPGYAGRTELPDNLKVLFRPVAMMVPSYALIAEVMLGAEGFGNSKVLADKMVQLYKLSSEQLSQQSHYDFGMRAVKSVLVMAGTLKRANIDQNERDVLIRAMKEANVPKFLQQDLPLFLAIVQDLFPEAQILEPDQGDFLVQIEASIDSAGLQKSHKVFKQKIIQLHETFLVRFGVMLVGMTGSGKTACYQILADVMTQLRNNRHPNDEFQKVVYNVINPKAISMGELYGEVDLNTQEWSDGLASMLMRAASSNPAAGMELDKIWTIFDGPVDALWIENMNTVLDDNMTLCLSNGQRIKLRPEMRMLFEVQDLAVASPATVSRCGMVYLTAEEMGWKPYVESWIQRKYRDEEILSKDLKEHLLDLFNHTIDFGLEKIRNGSLKEPIKTNDLQQVKSLCAYLEAFLTFDRGFKGDEKSKKKDLECVFAWSYAWGLGASLEQKGKEIFDNVVREHFKACQIPPADTVYAYFYDMKKDKCFKEWHTKVETFVFDKTLPFFDLIVPTTVTYAHKYCLEILLSVDKPAFFTGDSGVGKSVIVSNTLSILQTNSDIKLMPININFSAQTNSGRTQQSMLEKMEKMRQHYQPPPTANQIAIFVDDINMPSVEEYGAQPPIELLRMFLNEKGVYERSDWSWKEVRKATLIAAAAPPSGSRAELTPRFTTHFNMFCLPPAGEAMLSKIFGSILEGFLKGGFPEKVQQQRDAAINSTIEVYKRITAELRATPAKFHYTFNLRDVSKVFQGILMVKSSSVQNEGQFQRLWANETLRVFHDRLINVQDTTWFIDLMMELLNNNFKSGADRNDLFGETQLMFGDILKLELAGRPYEEIVGKDKLARVFNGKLEDYNAESDNRMNLVFFEDAMHHILRICRTLRQPRGNIMLIGVGGSGKQSLTKLSSYMYDMKFRMIEMKKDFKISDFRDLMKTLMFATGGVDNQEERKKCIPTVFTLTDSQIINETFLEDVNNVLNTGEIPNLMLPEDKDKIANDIREVVVEMKRIDTSDVIQQVFVDRVRENFHICLCMSPVGDSLRIRCRQFPSLVNCCTLDWFSRWPAEALLYVSSEFLKDIEMPSEEIRRQISEMCMIIHTSVEEISQKFYDQLRRRVYTTPKSYLDLIKLYLNKLNSTRREDNANKDRLARGLKKLNETNESIAALKEKLRIAQPQLEQLEKDLAANLEVSKVEKAIADEEERTVSAESEIVMKNTAEAKALMDEAEADLRKAQPLMDAAKRAVDKVDANSITEVKGFTTPPKLCEMVMECIMLFIGEKPQWDVAKKEMQNAGNFLKKLKGIEVAKLKEKQLAKIRKEYIEKKDKWDLNAIEKQSSPARNLAEWASAISSYQKVWKDVEPKKAKCAEQTKIVNEAQAELDKKMEKLRIVKDKVAKLDAEVAALNESKRATEAEMNQSKSRMVRAEKLVLLLANEGVRWKNDVANMTEQIKKLVGNVFLASACISYFGAFTGDFRKQLTDMWTNECIERKIPTDDTFSLPQVLGDPVEIRDWNLQGLPSDATSSENGILATQAERWGLCVDPQQQAHKWLINMHKGKNLIRLKGFDQKDFLRQMTHAVKNGWVVLIEDITEDISPSIDAILLRQEFSVDGDMKQIKMGDKFEDYDTNFRLYMTTKLANPEYKPEVCIKVTLINFTVTFQGLEEQLLGDVVIKERPEVEQQRDQIVLQMAQDSATLKQIEDKILKLLSESELEQILDEDTLIDILEKSKVIASEINERMASAVIVTEEIAVTRAIYNKVAVRGSILYFVIADMSRINDMYQNSLQFVKVLFNKAIDTAEQSSDQETRLDNLIDTVTRTVYTNICRGLFERDKLIFSFLIATSIDRYAEKISQVGWSIVLRGANPFTEEQEAKKPPNPLKSLLPDLAFDVVYSAQLQIPAFTGIVQSFEDEEKAWTEWILCDKPEEQALPGDWETKLTDFQKIMLLRAFRSEKMMFSFQHYVINHMGEFYVTSPTVTMSTVFKDTDNCTPLIFVLSTGADPTFQLYKFAEDMGKKDSIGTVSLGQGQGKKALNMILDSTKNGNWVLLQNCHLAKSFMAELERNVLNFASIKDDPDYTDEEKENFINFRLFLTSMPVDYFPVSVLQNSIKMTTEPPRGIKANLKRSYNEVTDQILDDCKRPEIWRKLFFGLAFFHAVMQERRKFGPLGFNNVYEFNDSDLETSQQMLKMFLEDQDEIPWDSLNYMTGQINYGGRVTDDWDRRCLLNTLLKYYCVDNLEDGYNYDEEGVYFCPPNGNAQSYKDYIESLPLFDTPGVFGLHANANISYQKQESAAMVETVLEIQPRVSSAAGGLTPEQMVVERITALQATIPELLDMEKGKKEIFKTHNGLLPSLTTVLVQEMEKFNRLLKRIRQSLTDLKDAIFGFVVMSDTLDQMFIKLQNGQVPANWESVAYPSLKPLSAWYVDLKARVMFLEEWLVNGNPKSYWISGFFFPQGFLTGVLQTHARLYKIPIDELNFVFEVMVEEDPNELEEEGEHKDGVIIHGFYMDGARWNREEHCVDDQIPGELYSTVPLIHFKPMQKVERDSEYYECPAYKTGARKGTLSTTGLSTNMILAVWLPSQIPPQVWVRRAAALLCQLND